MTNDGSANRQEQKIQRRQVPARLVEATPPVNGLGYWALASPLILFLAWWWNDIFIQISPLTITWLDRLLGLLIFFFLIVLPLGYLAHRLVTALPRPFQHAGWDVQPLAPVRPEEQYMVRYLYQEKERAELSRRRIWLRAAQGWVYLEIAAIFAGAVLMIPLFFSALDFGFGR